MQVISYDYRNLPSQEQNFLPKIGNSVLELSRIPQVILLSLPLNAHYLFLQTVIYSFFFTLKGNFTPRQCKT